MFILRIISSHQLNQPKPDAPPRAAQTETIAFGTVFSTMMVSMCGGSSLFKLMTEGLPVRFAFSPEACLVLATGDTTLQQYSSTARA